jgi:hypothetical protein
MSGRGNQSTRKKPTPVSLYSLQIPDNLTWAQTRAAALESRRLTAWAMARASFHLSMIYHMTWPGSNPGRSVENRLGYDMAFFSRNLEYDL